MGKKTTNGREKATNGREHLRQDGKKFFIFLFFYFFIFSASVAQTSDSLIVQTLRHEGVRFSSIFKEKFGISPLEYRMRDKK